MCTLSLVPSARGFRLGMNRDEQRTRAIAHGPTMFAVRGVRAVAPREPTGGTWIALNAHGLALALLNWYAEPWSPPGAARSRGEIIPALAGSAELSEVAAGLPALDLASTRPFRLVAVAAAERGVCEWRWNGRVLERTAHPWGRTHWFSSAVDEAAATRTRAAVCETTAMAADPTRPDWIRRLHGAHAPERGARSICMHRPDAETVSYTEIEVDATAATLTYHAGAPCRPGFNVAVPLGLARGESARGGT